MTNNSIFFCCAQAELQGKDLEKNNVIKSPNPRKLLSSISRDLIRFHGEKD